MFAAGTRTLSKTTSAWPAGGRRQQLGASDESGDADSESKRVDAGALFPPILLGDGAGARDKAECAAHHVLDFDGAQRFAFVKHRGEQHRKCGFVELNALPISPAAEPLVLIPVAVLELRRDQVPQGIARLLLGADRHQCAGGLDHVARPYEVVSA